MVNFSLVTMETGQIAVPSAFDTLFAMNVPHILENIFFSLDYKSFTKCMRVNKTWRELLTTARYQAELKYKLIEKKKNEKKFYLASKEGNAEELRRLIYDHLVDVNFNFNIRRTSAPGQSLDTTALIEAVSKGQNQVVRILLDAGADIERADGWSYVPLHWAAMNNHYETVKLLLDEGADVDKEDQWGRTSLLRAASEDVAKLLMRHGADPNKKAKDGIIHYTGFRL